MTGGEESLEARRAVLIREIEAQRGLMIAVATGGPRIRDVDAQYVQRRRTIQAALADFGIEDPNPYPDLWAWYGKWSVDLPSYQSRRQYIRELYEPLLERLARWPSVVAGGPLREPTGWARVDRSLDAIRAALETAATEEDHQAVGLRCRETLISLAQAVYLQTIHGSLDGTAPSDTDAKRMLEAYIDHELAGGANEEVRAHAKASLRLALALQHRRTAQFRDAAMCAEATTSVVNLMAIVSGRRDPEAGG